MTFIPTATLDRRAMTIWRQFALEPAFDAEELLDRMELSLLWETLDDRAGGTVLGALRPEQRLVLLNERHLEQLESNVGLRRFTIGHEIGHWVLHADGARSGSMLLALDAQGRTWCRSGSAERVERQAEVFAARLLMPWDLLRERMPPAGWTGWPVVYDLAEAFAVTPTAMVFRLEELGLAHLDADRRPQSGQAVPEGQTTLFG